MEENFFKNRENRLESRQEIPTSCLNYYSISSLQYFYDIEICEIT